MRTSGCEKKYLDRKVLKKLYDMAESGDFKALKRSMKKKGFRGDKKLFSLAIRGRNLEMLKYLMKKRCRKSDDSLCLAHAIDYGNMEIVRYFTESGFRWGSYAKSHACSRGNIELLKFMHDNSIELYFQYVAYSDSIECLKYILDLGYTLTIDDLISACSGENLEFLMMICSHVKIPKDKDVLFEMYKDIRDISILKYLYVETDKFIPDGIFCVYTSRGLFDFVKYLCEIGWKVNKNDTFSSIKSGNLEILKYLHENGYPFSSDYIWSDIKNYNNKIMFNGVVKYYHDNIQNCGYCSVSCPFCFKNKLETLHDLWVMESVEYDNYNQWLPREILEDFIDVYCTRQ